MILVFSLAFAWVFVEDLRHWIDACLYVFWGKKLPAKPFGCLKCMCGWSALAFHLAAGYGWQSIGYCLVAMFVGALFESIQMRYL